MRQTGAALVVETLRAAGVQHLFTLSGNQILSVYDATIGRDIRLIHTRHEAAAVHMADGWGRLTEQPGVALVTAGPGHCNSLSALYVALMAESPVVLLSGHCPRSQIGRGAFQEIDQVTAARPVTKASWLVEDPQFLGRDIAKALALAGAGRPGPVHLSLPSDVLESTVTNAAGVTAEGSPPTRLSDHVIRQLLDHLTAAKRPLMLAGPAMGRAMRWKKVEQLAKVTGIPALPAESPRGVNDPWLHGAKTCLSEADVVLLLGKKLDFSLRFGQPPAFSAQCRFIRIDNESEPPGDERRVALAVSGDPWVASQQLTEAAQERTWQSSSWREEVLAARNATPPAWQQLRRSQEGPIHPLRICAAVQPFLDAGAVLVADGGEFGQWAQAGLEASCRLINGLSGSIGSALPLGLAAKVAYPERQVFVALGDGTFGFHALEFDTALRYGLPIVAIVGNDARWNAEHQLQLQSYGAERAVGCDLLPSSYDKVAQALGGHGEFVEDPKDLEPALKRAVESGRPACINIVIEGVAAPTGQLGRDAH